MSEFDRRRTWGPQPKYPCVEAWPNTPLGAYRTHETLPAQIVIAGPCSVESEEQVESVIPALTAAGVTFARGGVYRAGTYPRSDGLFGLQRELMAMWSANCRRAGLRVIMEVLDVRQAEDMAEHSDAFQVGARHMQDYALLRELAGYDRVVTLKRHPGSTLDEFLGAAEYLARGRCTPVLIERGGSTFLNHVRWDLSISLIAAAKRLTGLPVLVDASHGTGRRDLVESLTLAGIAAGADGFLVEVHPDPEKSLSDSDQALPLEALETLVRKAKAVREAARG